MNIIFIISDSLRFDIAQNIDFEIPPSIRFNNHWTNNTWTIPSFSTILTGKLPNNCYPIYSSDPHRISQQYLNNDLWNNIYGKYYSIISSPWSPILELCSNINRIYGTQCIQTETPYLSNPFREGYYQKRFDRKNGIKLKSLPTPFFHIYHTVKTHSEFGLDTDEFYNSINFLDEKMQFQANRLNQKINYIYDNVPNDTLIILTSDHGEDFEEIKKGNCGHATCFSNEVLRVPLLMWYKGKNIFSEKEIDILTDHIDLHNTLSNFLQEKKDFDIRKKDYLIFSQGCYWDKDSIKFMTDSVIGIKDFTKNTLYTQSMKTEQESGNLEDKDRYRKLIVDYCTYTNNERTWTQFGKSRSYDEISC